MAVQSGEPRRKAKDSSRVQKRAEVVCTRGDQLDGLDQDERDGRGLFGREDKERRDYSSGLF